MERRKLGATGAELSVIGFGGILVMDETPEESARIVSYAISRGVNYFDVAPTYGNAQQMLGPALEPYRKDVFLACKTTERTADRAEAELQESLRALRTGYFDLYQMHGLSDEEVETAFGPGGAVETLSRARRQGLTRFLGFSSHSETAALAAMERFSFDTVMFPVSRSSWHAGGVGPRVISAAVKRGMGIVALKALGKRKLAKGEERPWKKCWYHPVENFGEAVAGIRFTLSQPVTAALSPGHEPLFRWACDAADSFVPLSPQETEAMAREALTIPPIFSVS